MGGNIYFTICGCTVTNSVVIILQYVAEKSQNYGWGGNIYFIICGCNVAKSVYLILEYAATKSQDLVGCIWHG